MNTLLVVVRNLKEFCSSIAAKRRGENSMISTIAGACWSHEFPSWKSFWDRLGLTRNPRLEVKVRKREQIMKGEVKSFHESNSYSNRGQFCDEIKDLAVKFWVSEKLTEQFCRDFVW